MKNILLLIKLTACTLIVNAQTPSISWGKCYGGTNDELAINIKPTFDGGYVIFGTTKSNDGDISNNHGGIDAWVLKIDSVGSVQWSKTIGGSLDDLITWGEQTKDSGYIFCGNTTSVDGDLTSLNHYGSADAWLVKLNKSGNIVWQQTMGSTKNDAFTSVKENFAGDYVALGFSDDVWQIAIKFNQLGGIKKSSSFIKYIGHSSHTKNAYTGTMTLTKDSSFLYSYSQERISNGPGGNGNTWGEFGIKKMDTALQLYNPCFSCNETYVPINYSIQEASNLRILELANRDILISGYYNTTTMMCGNSVCVKAFQASKYSKVSQSLLWSNFYYCNSSISLNYENAKCNSSCTSNNGCVVLAGATKGDSCLNCNSAFYKTYNHNSTTYDSWIIQIDSQGNLLWQKCFGGTNDDFSSDIINTKDSGLIVVNTTKSNDGDVIGNHGGSDIWLFKLAPILLPTNLTSFKAKKENSRVLLNWESTNEINVSHFNIQRSENGKEFIIIGKTNAKGSGAYSFVDKDFAITTITYYRLEIVDKDGLKTHSNVQIINNASTIANNAIFPNPAKEHITITGNFQEVKIINSIGKTLITKQTNVGQLQNIVNISNLTKGIYFVQCISKDKTVTHKLLVE